MLEAVHRSPSLLALPQLEIVAAPPAEAFAAIYRALDQETSRQIGTGHFTPLAVLLRDGGDGIIGGLWGITGHSWLAITLLFVPMALRGRGLGARIVGMAEAAAAGRGCIGAQVDAFDFQATGFYRRLGYQSFGVLENCPPGQRRTYLCKQLRPEREALNARSDDSAACRLSAPSGPSYPG